MDNDKKEALELIMEYYLNIDSISDERVNCIMSKLERISPDPQFSDYIFYPEAKELTPEEIVEKIFSYNTIRI